MVSRKPKFIVGGILSGLLGLWFLLSAFDLVMVAANSKTTHLKASDIRTLETVMMWSAIIPVALIALIVWSYRNKVAAWKRQQTAAQTQAANDQAYLADLEARGPQPVHASGLVLQGGEVAYYQTQATEYIPKTTTRRLGGYGGLSVPTGIKGIRAHFGSIASTPISSTNFESQGVGTLTATNKRIIFIGNFGSKSTPVNKLLNVEPYKDGARLEIENGKPIVYVTGDVRFAATLMAMMQPQTLQRAGESTTPSD